MNHKYFMKKALKEALKGQGYVSPNPLVGALVIHNNQIMAQGYHGEEKNLHAEKIVLKKAQTKKFNLKEATLYVTLEPCCHYGKTPPCTDAIIKSGLKKIVIAQIDPNPLVAGKGIQILKKAGLEIISGILEKEAQYQIRFFRFWITQKQPYFLAKIAISKNQCYALKNQNKLISNPQTKKYTKKLRTQFDAILIGKKTLLTDNPHLGSKKNNLIRIIVCQNLDFSPEKLQVFRDNKIIIFYKKKLNNYKFPGKLFHYQNLAEIPAKIFQLKIQSVLVEGGGQIIDLFLQKNLIQEILLVKSLTVNLTNGLKAPVIPAKFQLIQEKKLKYDHLVYYQHLHLGASNKFMI